MRGSEGFPEGEQRLVNLITGDPLKTGEDLGLVASAAAPVSNADSVGREESRGGQEPKDPRVIGYIEESRTIFTIRPWVEISLVCPGSIKELHKITPLTHTDRLEIYKEWIGKLGGKVNLDVRVGPVKTRWDFYVCLEAGIEVVLGADFLFSQQIFISGFMPALICERQGNELIPLLDAVPLYTHCCRLKEDVVFLHGTNVIPIFMQSSRVNKKRGLLRAADLGVPEQEKSGKESQVVQGLVYLNHIPLLWMTIAEQVTRDGGFAAVEYWGTSNVHLPAGWNLSRCYRENKKGTKSCHIQVCEIDFEKDVVRCQVVQNDPVGESRESGWPPGKRSKIQHQEEGIEGKTSPMKTCVNTAKVEGKEDAAVPTPEEEATDKRKREDEQWARNARHDFIFSLPTLPCPDSALTKVEEVAVRRLIAEFADISNDGTRPLGVTNIMKAKLETGDVRPISFPARRVALQLREAMREEVAGLEKDDTIEPSTGNWSVPVVMVKKKGGA